MAQATLEPQRSIQTLRVSLPQAMPLPVLQKHRIDAMQKRAVDAIDRLHELRRLPHSVQHAAHVGVAVRYFQDAIAGLSKAIAATFADMPDIAPPPHKKQKKQEDVGDKEEISWKTRQEQRCKMNDEASAVADGVGTTTRAADCGGVISSSDDKLAPEAPALTAGASTAKAIQNNPKEAIHALLAAIGVNDTDQQDQFAYELKKIIDTRPLEDMPINGLDDETFGKLVTALDQQLPPEVLPASHPIYNI